MNDRIDRKLLKHIQNHGNATNAELGEAIGISTSQAGRRKQRLEKEGVIVGYRARLKPEKLGLHIQAFIQISLGSHSHDNAVALRDHLATQDEIVNIWTMTGAADYLLQVYCQDLAALNHLVHDVLLNHENVARVESQIVMNHLKAQGVLPIAEY